MLRPLMTSSPLICPEIAAIIQAKTKTTLVLSAVATSESQVFTPHFARIEVSPAKIAEPAAAKSHIDASSRGVLLCENMLKHDKYPKFV